MKDANKVFSKSDYGDWQTNYPLALSICKLLKRQGVSPQVVIEPTCGKGSFILAALEVFDSIEDVYGIEINPAYLESLRISLNSKTIQRKIRIHLINDDVFKVDFGSVKAALGGKNVLVLGNPPWVTNSELGKSGVGNLPVKSNFKHVKGLAAITGKGNFDIAEYICYMMMRVFLDGNNGTIAMLLKNSVIKNIIYEQRNNGLGLNATQYKIDTEREFAASASASLFVARKSQSKDKLCQVYDFYTGKYLKTYGWVGSNFVADSEKYCGSKDIDGKSSLTWWSGLKHDCSKVLELSRKDSHYFNKLNERVDIEDGIIYPFIKSSDLKGDEINTCRKYIILTQHKTSDSTENIKNVYPRAYEYLQNHAKYFEERKSSIYKNRPRFCMFGIGDYTFKRYRIAISGLYKQPHFSLVSEIEHKQALLDDTTYLLGFDNAEYAKWTLKVLNSPLVQSFIGSISFDDAKRPINKDLLMRIDIAKAISMLGRDFFGVSSEQFENFRRYIQPVIQNTLF